MALKQDWDLALDVDSVLAAQGADPAAIRQRHPGLVAAAERALSEGLALLAPNTLRRTLAVVARDRRGLHLAGGGRLHGTSIEQQLCAADEIAVAVCTIGGALEQRVATTLHDDAVLALALDGLGTAAVDALASALCSQVAAEAEATGSQATVPYSPGMMGWSLAEGQDQVFSLVDTREIGVTLTASRLMVPRKSVSMVIGLGPRVTKGRRTCDVCEMKDTCRYRLRSSTGDA